MGLLKATGLHRYTRKHLVHDRDAARAEVLRLEGVIRGLDTTVSERDERISQLEADAVDVSVERKLRTGAEEWASELHTELCQLRAREANANAITLPRAHRDIDADETATEPGGIDVRSLRDALNPAVA
ncbi:hypothetical protein ACFWCA_32595 [Streptomyces phaeochromogenes]|uniref:hypothetical protein n=1 Tax=Streptomyces phaeochromogenes TaxID=1923 RepID=UPI0036B0667B